MAAKGKAKAEARLVEFASPEDKARARLEREIAGLTHGLTAATRARDAAQADIDRTQPIIKRMQAELRALGA